MSATIPVNSEVSRSPGAGARRGDLFLAKVEVASSNLVYRSTQTPRRTGQQRRFSAFSASSCMTTPSPLMEISGGFRR